MGGGSLSRFGGGGRIPRGRNEEAESGEREMWNGLNDRGHECCLVTDVAKDSP